MKRGIKNPLVFYNKSKKIESDQQRREIIQKFREMIEDYTKNKKYSKNERAQIDRKIVTSLSVDEKIAKKLGVSARTIYYWKREFGLSVNNKISDATKIGILKKYAKIKEKNPKMSDYAIADLLKISINSLRKWKAQFRGRN